MHFRFVFITLCSLASAESGRKAWLRYAPPPSPQSVYDFIPSHVIILDTTKSGPVYTASQELVEGVASMFGIDIYVTDAINATQSNPAIVGTIDAYEDAYPGELPVASLQNDGFYIDISDEAILILGKNERGTLYGTFAYLSSLALGTVSDTTYISNPDVPIRWVNQWDNLHGRGSQGPIERGYAGASIFFDDGFVRDDLERAREYSRLLASIGINAVIVNNVNADSQILNDRNIDGLARIADVFRPYGVQLGISCYFTSPEDYGLPTADPLDDAVIAWWNNITETLYDRIPDMAGYLIKANSEGQPGPLTYNRTLAEGANMFARALQPHGGTVMFRAFIYDAAKLDLERNWRDDRATQAVEFFEGLDGAVDDNVVIQIKNGPIDFQVREPVSSLFSHIKQTKLALEVQVTQEYLGQQCHLAYLAPMYKEIMDFDFAIEDAVTPLSAVINGRQFNRSAGGYAAVVNVGMDETWLGSHLAMSNLYAYGHQAWDPSSQPETLVQDWTRLTFGHDKHIIDTITDMSLTSWPAYENYTANLGLLSMIDAATHFGPDPASRVHSSIATRSYQGSVGIDRTVRNGSGYAGQYPERVADMYENVETTPDELLLFFHHVPYTHRLHSGNTVIQQIYDAHYAGAETVHDFVRVWMKLQDKIDTQRYEHVLYRLEFQAGHAIVWRDAISDFFHGLTGIPDDANRVGNYKGRIEAENMELDGYTIRNVNPSVSASGGRAIMSNSRPSIATTTLDFVDGEYNLAVNYFDLATGNSTWQVFLNDRSIGGWYGDAEFKLGHAPANDINGVSAMRVTFRGLEISRGDVLKIEGASDGQELATVDYISILPLD